jgi:3-methyladenine DNA glycosylase AlkD
MNAKDVVAALRKSGKPQTAAIYKRLGSGDNVCGVLTSELPKLKKKIKIDHDLAMDLWKTGSAEARILALQVADPQRITKADPIDSSVKGRPGSSRSISPH